MRPVFPSALLAVVFAAACGRGDAPATERLYLEDPVAMTQVSPPSPAMRDSLLAGFPVEGSLPQDTLPEEALVSVAAVDDSVAADPLSLLEDVPVAVSDGADPLAFLEERPAPDTSSAVGWLLEEDPVAEEDSAGAVPGVSPAEAPRDTASAVPAADTAGLFAPVPDGASGMEEAEDPLHDFLEAGDTMVYVKLDVHKDINQHFEESAVVDSSLSPLPEGAVPAGTRQSLLSAPALSGVVIFLLGVVAAVLAAVAIKLVLPGRHAAPAKEGPLSLNIIKPGPETPSQESPAAKTDSDDSIQDDNGAERQ